MRNPCTSSAWRFTPVRVFPRMRFRRRVFFRRAADMGHAQTTFMYRDCLMDWVGVKKDKARALIQLLEASERGYRGARGCVLAVLEDGGSDNGMFTDSSRMTFNEDDEEKEEDDEAYHETNYTRRR
mmetsp:Transcript_59985/g.72086  ORF Transcript_59985/g.72086 Transcript_59985/m.72086 type:complete len:126 (-) Transcript_59985:183-560(-)